MDLKRLFADHISRLQATYEKALAELVAQKGAPTIEAVLIHSGSEGIYYGDDRHIPFESFGHFRHWVPLNKPEQMVLIRPGHKPTFFQVVPPDFWYEQGVERQAWWDDCFEVVELDAAEKVFDHLPPLRRIAFLGENTGFAANLGLPAILQNEKHLSNYLDFYRGMKSEYEVAMIREANRTGMIGHRAAEQAFLNFGGELDIHRAFLNATDMIETDSPYTNIVGLDDKGAVLHYQNKRRESGKNSKVLLIDAGCRANGYASDITRTYARQGAHPVFRSILEKMDRLQLELVAMGKPGMPYLEIHSATHTGVLDILMEHDLVRGDREQLEEQNISKIFFPHGVGHLLGIQVHDVGGFFKDKSCVLAPAPREHRFLRLTRQIEEGMVYTIEPGFYFIPVLLDPERGSDKGKLLNWGLIDQLIPCGGIRIEDNILVNAQGAVNLTR